MNPLVVLLGGGAALYLLVKSGKSSSSEMATGPRVRIVGASKISWFIEHLTDTNAGYIYTKVTVPHDQFGAQGETSIFTFATPIGKSIPNSLVSLNPEAGRVLLDKAIADFNVSVPAGLELPEE